LPPNLMSSMMIASPAISSKLNDKNNKTDETSPCLDVPLSCSCLDFLLLDALRREDRGNYQIKGNKRYLVLWI